MTTETPPTASRRRRIATSSVLCALALTATACGTSGTEDSAVSTDVAESVDGATGVDGLEYGDSLEDLTHASAQASQPLGEAVPGFRPVEWDELIPPGFSSEEVLARYEERLKAAQPRSAEMEALYEEMNAEFDTATVNPELDSEKVHLAGFVAPLTYDGDNITEFLLVPYFGACIHVPPPPVNQTVMVTLAEGESLTLEESWGAVWVAGILTATTTDTELATAGYSISGPAFGTYRS